MDRAVLAVLKGQAMKMIWTLSVVAGTSLSLWACGGEASLAKETHHPTAPSDTKAVEADPMDSADGTQGEQESTENEFTASDYKPTEAQLNHPSNLTPSLTEAVVKFFVLDKDKGPVEGIVIALTDPDGRNYYTDETDAEGYAEILLPIGKRYELVYLSLGRQDVVAKVDVPNEPKLNLRLTLRYKKWIPEQPVRGANAPTPKNPPPADSPRFVLDGVEFDTGKAVLRASSKEELEQVIAYMAHKKSARIEISGHTDNVGPAKANMALSKKRAEAVRTYMIKKGIDGSRIEAVGYGDTMPIGDNNTEEGRQRNRRIEATEL